MTPTLEKFLTSRKLWAFAAATALLACGVISEETWRWCFVSYVGSQALPDFAEKIKPKVLKIEKPEK